MYLCIVSVLSTLCSPLDLWTLHISRHPHHSGGSNAVKACIIHVYRSMHHNYAVMTTLHHHYIISVEFPVRARCVCRGSFQFWNWTTPLTARVVPSLNLATSCDVSKPAEHCIYINYKYATICLCFKKL